MLKILILMSLYQGLLSLYLHLQHCIHILNIGIQINNLNIHNYFDMLIGFLYNNHYIYLLIKHQFRLLIHIGCKYLYKICHFYQINYNLVNLNPHIIFWFLHLIQQEYIYQQKQKNKQINLILQQYLVHKLHIEHFFHLNQL